MNTQTYASSKSLKGIDRPRVVKGKPADKDDFDGTPTAPPSEVPQPDSSASCDTQDTPKASLSKERPYRKGMTYNKTCVGTPIIQDVYKRQGSGLRPLTNIPHCCLP